MPKVKNVEKKIWDVEGFDVVIRKDGKDVHGNKMGLPQWRGENRTKETSTVKDFEKKFQQQYPGYEVDVLDGDGQAVHGNTLLKNVRDTYKD